MVLSRDKSRSPASDPGPFSPIISALSTAAAASSDRLYRARRRADYFARVARIFADMKLAEARLSAEPDAAARAAAWEVVHARNAPRVLDLALTLRGFYVKAGQLLSTRADFVPDAWVRALKALQEDVPPMPAGEVRAVVEGELGALCRAEFEASRREGRGVGLSFCKVYGEGRRVPAEAVFDGVDWARPVGSASLACVFKARLRGSGEVVAVKVQNPASRLVAGDVDSLVTVGRLLEKTDLRVNFTSFLEEIRRQVKRELDFRAEGETLNAVRFALRDVPRVQVPRAHMSLTTPRLLVMDFVRGKSLQAVRDDGATVPPARRAAFGRLLLRTMAHAWGTMIFGDGLFHGDAHPGNLLVHLERRRLLGGLLPPRLHLGIIDLGQSKQLPRRAQRRLARLVLALADPATSDFRVAGALRDTGVQFERMGGDEDAFLARAARLVFCTEAVDGKAFNPFGKDSFLFENGVTDIPPDLVFVIRVIQMQRGIAAALGCDDFALSREWRAAAAQCLERRSR